MAIVRCSGVTGKEPFKLKDLCKNCCFSSAVPIRDNPSGNLWLLCAAVTLPGSPAYWKTRVLPGVLNHLMSGQRDTKC